MALPACDISSVLLVLLVSVVTFTKHLDAAALVSDANPYFGSNGLEQRSRENEAVARLYENVLDALQCRPPPAPQPADEILRIESVQSSNEPFAARQPVQDLDWSGPRRVLGQVAGVAVDPQGRPVVFHRGDHTWEYDSFDGNYRYTKGSEGPIGVNAVLTLNPTSGDVEDEWGTDQFYLPHGIHIDAHGNFWLTDVALHQVFKFPRRKNPSLDAHQPSLVLGERFVPGDDARHFCQPTAVVTMPGDGGEVVVADGYCNERIVVFDREGRPLAQLPPRGNENFLRLRVPHSLAILKRGDVCVADREHQRIVCFNLTRALESVEARDRASSYLPLAIHRPGVCRIFGIASHDDMLYAINGPTTPSNPVMGFTISPDQGSVLSTWSPTYDTFTNPHGIATSANGSTLYVSEIGPNVVWKFRLLGDWKM